MDNKIIYVKTPNCQEIRGLIEILREVMNEIKIDFIKDKFDKKESKEDTQNVQNVQKNESKQNESKQNGSKQNESKQIEKKNQKNKKKEEHDSDTELSDEENVKSKKKNKKNEKNEKNEKKNEESDEVDEEEDEPDDKNKSDEKSKQDEKIKPTVMGGIRILALDDHKTLMIYVKLNSDKFDEFRVRYPTYSIGLDLTQLHKFLKTIEKGSIMTMSIDKDDEQNIVFQVQNDGKNNDSVYTQKLMDINEGEKKIPHDASFEISVIMDTGDFHKICREAYQFSEFVEITCTSKKIMFKCQGDSNAYCKTIKNADGGVKIVCLNENNKPIIVQVIFELKYLVTFGKCVNLCDDIQLYLKNDYPIFIQYTIADLGKMLVGLTPVDMKTIKKTNNYDEKYDKYYTEKKVVIKK